VKSTYSRYGLAALLALGTVTPAGAGNGRDELFKTVRDSVVILTAGQLSGSGFICELEGERYLITNEHIVRGGDPLKAKLIDGRELRVVSLEVADDRDLVRMKLATNSPPLDARLLPADELPDIGEAVTVYGNSDGGGVATSVGGRLLGVGPVLVELDAPFVSGNSGSPIVNTNGRVVGVATFVTHDREPDNWIKKGTRFAEVRRFGVRLAASNWKAISPRDYIVRANALRDMETFCVDLYNIRFTTTYRDPETRLLDYKYAKESQRYRNSPELCKLLADAAQTFNAAIAMSASARTQVGQAAKARSRMEFENARRQLNVDARLADARAKEHAATYERVQSEARIFIRNKNWMLPCMKEDARFWLDVLTRIVEDEPE
jgi:hypothetical protein